MTLAQTIFLLLFNLKRLSRLTNLRNTMGIGSRLESSFIRSPYTGRLTRKLSPIKGRRLSSLPSTWERTPKDGCNSILKSTWRKGLCSHFRQLLYWYYNSRSLSHNYAPCLEKKTLSRILRIKLYSFDRLAILPDMLLLFKHWGYSVIGEISDSRLSSITDLKTISKTKSPG